MDLRMHVIDSRFNDLSFDLTSFPQQFIAGESLQTPEVHVKCFKAVAERGRRVFVSYFCPH